MKIYSAIKQGVEILKSNYISSAHLDSEILMATAINKDRQYIILNSNKKLNPNDLINFNKLIKNRSHREPVAYLTNKKFFWKSEFFVTKDTLIPRPDTELLIECLLKLSRNKKLRKKYGKNSRKLVESDMALDHVCHQYYSLYREIIC